MAATVTQRGLTFADVLIVPSYSNIDTRTDIDVTTDLFGARRLPIISAPMDYVTGYDMAKELASLNAYGIVNRFTTERFFSVQPEQYGIAIGTKDLQETKFRITTESPHSVCIDVAHGHHKKVIDLIGLLRKEFPNIWIMAGNVATSDGFRQLAAVGADAVRVGIGPGSACSTRETTGVGVPQLTAIMDCARIKERLQRDVKLIADGGIQTPGDIVKALAAGADAVMLGRMLAGHDESPGIETDGHKPYRGQSLLGTNGARGAPEGVEGTVPARGPVKNTLDTLMHYLRSGMSYVGANNLTELRELAEFIEVSPGTFQESQTRL